MKPKPAQEHWYRAAICLHEFGQHLVAPRLQILEIFWVIGAKPHHHGKMADLSGTRISLTHKKFDHGLLTLRHDQLHWPIVPERVTFKRFLVMYRCLHAQALWYLIRGAFRTFYYSEIFRDSLRISEKGRCKTWIIRSISDILAEYQRFSEK